MKRTWIGFAGGIIVGIVVAFLAAGGGRKVSAQAPHAAPRYQIAVWGYPGSAPGGLIAPATHGAYIIDTVSGKLWVSRDNGEPTAIGQVK